MNLYAFELGRIKSLCLAELDSVLGGENSVEISGPFAIFKLDASKFAKDPNALHRLQNRLGGTIKIAEVTETLPLSASKKDIKDSLQRILVNHLKGHSGKIPFALSIPNLAGNPNIFLKFFLNFSKVFIKSLGFNCRFVNKQWQNPTSAQIYKSRSVEKGIDLTILKGKSGIHILKTVSIQDIDAYSSRDYGKPFRDPHMGMLPPKLAQIMLNLAEPSNKVTSAPQVIFDPFCGSGTIPMEALLQGKKAVGSDIDPKAVEGTIKNLNWLKENFFGKSSASSFKVFQKDASLLASEDLPKNLDAIISETSLGSPISRLPSPNMRAKTFQDLSILHKNWLSNLKKILTPKELRKIKIVITLPAFNLGKNSFEYFTNFRELAEELGFKILNKSRLVYSRSDQLIGREIIVLKQL